MCKFCYCLSRPGLKSANGHFHTPLQIISLHCVIVCCHQQQLSELHNARCIGIGYTAINPQRTASEQRLTAVLCGRRLTNLRYAHDLILIYGSASELQELMARVQSTSTELGRRTDVKTTAVMSMNTSEKPEVSIYGEQVQIVNSLKYLDA